MIPPPVSPTLAADALHALSPPTLPPQSTRRAAVGLYAAGGVTPRLKRHAHPRRRCHQRRRRGYSEFSLPPPSHCHQSAKPPPALHSRRRRASSQAPYTAPPPVSPTPAAGVLRTLSPPTAPPPSIRKAAAGFYTAGGVTHRPKRHTQPRRRSHQRRRRMHSTLSLLRPPHWYQPAESPPACTEPAASRIVPSATQSPSAGLTNAGGGCTAHCLSSEPPTGISPQSLHRLVHSRRLHASSQAPHTPPPPVSPMLAAGVLHTPSTPPPHRHQSSEPTTACIKPAAARRVPSASHTPAAGLTNAGRGVATTNPCPDAGPDGSEGPLADIEFPGRLQSQSRRRPDQ